ncbi:uncharacterized protein BO88DRAFT_415428 [Aspergillus vadensis CBS 113365]|uniref:Uncharacterized protein n=1 Tax=Aspergillus vadensis (strain CBS 113365 / IMI 142717 / IBT 24658) TaxID=1448311 RepID=A0A319B8I4_ASPVC|nr:hypothetical protein BO88DRAFT_415428 [Aspergillus vadensis CBS 113365]PYH68865.1 hypothetical protein BO88DRAFT_415428 [Aspergillus vadensis CBS 113365]
MNTPILETAAPDHGYLSLLSRLLQEQWVERFDGHGYVDEAGFEKDDLRSVITSDHSYPSFTGRNVQYEMLVVTSTTYSCPVFLAISGPEHADQNELMALIRENFRRGVYSPGADWPKFGAVLRGHNITLVRYRRNDTLRTMDERNILHGIGASLGDLVRHLPIADRTLDNPYMRR